MEGSLSSRGSSSSSRKHLDCGSGKRNAVWLWNHLCASGNHSWDIYKHHKIVDYGKNSIAPEDFQLLVLELSSLFLVDPCSLILHCAAFPAPSDYPVPTPENGPTKEPFIPGFRGLTLHGSGDHCGWPARCPYSSSRIWTQPPWLNGVGRPGMWRVQQCYTYICALGLGTILHSLPLEKEEGRWMGQGDGKVGKMERLS